MASRVSVLTSKYGSLLNKIKDTQRRKLKEIVKYTDRLDKLMNTVSKTYGVDRPHEMVNRVDISEDENSDFGEEIEDENRNYKKIDK